MPVTRCASCGTARRGDLQVCVRCETPFPELDDLDAALPRPAGPSPTQSHGTVLVAVVIGFVLLLSLFYVTTRGVGPFAAEIRRSGVTAGTMTADVSVRNEGKKTGRANCEIRLVDADGAAQPKGHRFLTDKIAPRQTLAQTVVFPVESGTRATSVTC